MSILYHMLHYIAHYFLQVQISDPRPGNTSGLGPSVLKETSVATNSIQAQCKYLKRACCMISNFIYDVICVLFFCDIMCVHVCV